jgi:prephenate dehydrogenase
VRDADLCVFCLPIRTIADFLEECREAFSADCIITDVGSTKEAVEVRAAEILGEDGPVFIGSHPVAGSEQEGIAAAHDALYDNAMVVLTPGNQADSSAVDRLRVFWESVGSKVVLLTPQAHDRVLARTSHLPHLVAAALVDCVARDGCETDASPFCGTGFKDTTRIADGAPRIWRDIVETNAGAIVTELEECMGRLQLMADWLDRRDFDAVESYLQDCRDARRELLDSAELSGEAEGRGTL